MAGQDKVSSGKVPSGLLRRLYDKCMDWLATPYGIPVLFVISFVESSFFPIPPDVFLIALCIAVPKKSFKYALTCTVGSVCGGMLGYGLGFWFMDGAGQAILAWYHLADKYESVSQLYNQYDAWAIGAAGFTPLPYKLFTITAGAFKINFTTFVLVSCLARGARFFLVALLIFKLGAPVKFYIDKYFNLLSILFLVLLIAGFFLVGYIFR